MVIGISSQSCPTRHCVVPTADFAAPTARYGSPFSPYNFFVRVATWQCRETNAANSAIQKSR